MRDGTEEGTQVPALGIERLRPLPERQENVLGHVLGRPPVADDAAREPEHERTELVVHLGQRAGVTVDEARLDVVLPRSSLRHFHLTPPPNR